MWTQRIRGCILIQAQPKRTRSFMLVMLCVFVCMTVVEVVEIVVVAAVAVAEKVRILKLNLI